MYIVKDGIKHTMDIMGIDPPTPRQLFKIEPENIFTSCRSQEGAGGFRERTNNVIAMCFAVRV